MIFYKWYYNNRFSKTEDRWDMPIEEINDFYSVISYVIDAHNDKSIFFTRSTLVNPHHLIDVSHFLSDHKTNPETPEDLPYKELIKGIFNL